MDEVFALLILIVVDYVSGVALLDARLYVVYRLSDTVSVFTSDMYKEVQVVTVKGMRFPLDIVACSDDRQLYVADSGNLPAEQCVWRVSQHRNGISK